MTKGGRSAGRCRWVDLLRGWAVLVMMEVHVVNVFLRQGLAPEWLHFINGLVAPSFIFCAGFAMALSVFQPDGTLRPFWPSAQRIGVILLCAYLMHAPGYTWQEWTVFATPQRYRELCKIDVLQCTGVSLLLLHGLARAVRRTGLFALLAFLLATAVAWVAPRLWQTGMGQGAWMVVRGFINGNTDRGVQSLFPLFPWFSFAGYGAVAGVLYRWGPNSGKMTVKGWLWAMAGVGMPLVLWGTWQADRWAQHFFPQAEMWRIKTTTLASVAQRLGVVCLLGSALGAWSEWRSGKQEKPSWVPQVGADSLLLYVVHLRLIFDVLLAEWVCHHMGWGWYQLGWGSTLLLTAGVIAASLALSFGWRASQQHPQRHKWVQHGAWLWAGLYFCFWNTFFSPLLWRF